MPNKNQAQPFKAFGQLLQARINELDLKNYQVVEMLGLKRGNTVSDWVLGRSMPEPENLHKLAQVLKLNEEVLWDALGPESRLQAAATLALDKYHDDCLQTLLRQAKAAGIIVRLPTSINPDKITREQIRILEKALRSLLQANLELQAHA